MRIFVETPDNRTLNFDVLPDCTIAEICHRVANATKVPPFCQKLCVLGKPDAPLRNVKKSLRDCGISHLSVLTMSVRVKRRSEPSSPHKPVSHTSITVGSQQWSLSQPVAIWSQSASRWCPGEIAYIAQDADGYYLQLEYATTPQPQLPNHKWLAFPSECLRPIRGSHCPRSDWRRGSKVECFSFSQNRWCKATVVKVIRDADDKEDLLKVKWSLDADSSQTMYKEVGRGSIWIRPRYPPMKGMPPPGADPLKALFMCGHLGRHDILCSSLAQLTALIKNEDAVDGIVCGDMCSGVDPRVARKLHARRVHRRRLLVHGFVRQGVRGSYVSSRTMRVFSAFAECDADIESDVTQRLVYLVNPDRGYTLEVRTAALECLVPLARRWLTIRKRQTASQRARIQCETIMRRLPAWFRSVNSPEHDDGALVRHLVRLTHSFVEDSDYMREKMLDDGLLEALNGFVDPCRSVGTLRRVTQLCEKLEPLINRYNVDPCMLLEGTEYREFEDFQSYLVNNHVAIMYGESADVLCSGLRQLRSVWKARKDPLYSTYVLHKVPSKVRDMYARKVRRRRLLFEGFVQDHDMPIMPQDMVNTMFAYFDLYAHIDRDIELDVREKIKNLVQSHPIEVVDEAKKCLRGFEIVRDWIRPDVTIGKWWNSKPYWHTEDWESWE